MDVRTSFEWALSALLVSLVLMFVAIAGTKLWRQERDRRRAAAVLELRPLVIRAIETGEQLPLAGSRARVCESIVVSLLPKLRGDDRDALTALLVDLGLTDRALRGLRSRFPSRRLRGAQVLGASGLATAVDQLIGLLDDRDADVRLAAIHALGRIGDPLAAGALFRTLDGKRATPHAVTMALMRLGPAVTDDVVDALRSGSRLRRTVAAELVGSLGIYQARRDLEAMIDDEGELALAAIRALGRLGSPHSIGPLAEMLEPHVDDLTPAVVARNVAIVRSLGSIGDRNVEAVLRWAQHGPYRVAAEAERALRAMGLEAQEPELSEITFADPLPIGTHGIPDLLPVPPRPSTFVPSIDVALAEVESGWSTW